MLRYLIPWERNPKTISKSHARRLLDLWKRIGQFQTIAIGPNGEVYDGHQRLSVLKAAYGENYEVMALQSSRPLTEQERQELTIAAHTGTVGQFNWDELANWDAGSLQEWGMDAETLREWRTDVGALSNMLEAAKPHADAEPQIDRAAELLEKWQVKTGDLWRIGEHRLLCGDSTKREDVEMVMGGEKADLGFADPPYNADVDQWDKDFIWSHDYLSDLCDYVIVTPGISSAGQFFKITQMPYKWTLAAYISNGHARSAVGFGNWMFAPLFSNNSVYKQNRDAIQIDLIVGEATGEHHRGQKPPQFMEWIINLYCNAIMLDVFSGSGTTLVACQNLSRKCRAIEIIPAYCAVTLERMETAFPGIEIERIDSLQT